MREYAAVQHLARVHSKSIEVNLKDEPAVNASTAYTFGVLLHATGSAIRTPGRRW
jgi:hypothetical protein